MSFFVKFISCIFLRPQSTLSSKIKMLKNMKVLLYTYFYNVSLNVLRQPFSIYIIYLFHALQILGKLGSTLGQKLTTFPTLWAPAPTELQFSIIFFHRYVANQETNRTVHVIFFFPNIFWIIKCQICFQSLSSYCNKKWISHY